jgi:large subunit ribosomal protein L35Ae
MTKGIVLQFRRGRKTFKPRHFLIEVEGIDKREDASKFVGKKVVWTSPGKLKKEINGVVSSAHGNSGVIRCIFEKGLPGQAIGTEVEISGGKN